MKIGKLITYNVLTVLLTLNIFYLYFSGGLQPFSFTKEYIYLVLKPLLQALILFLTALFISMSYITKYASTKKNLQRVSLISVFILMCLNIIKRILEYKSGIFWIAGNVSMLLYIILFILNILILRDLFLLIKKLFNKEIEKKL